YEAMEDSIREANGDGAALAREFEWFREELGEFKFALTRPYFDVFEKKQANSGGLFSITINPTTCKGCMECVEVCHDDALKIVKQT
ncbi:MAG TPA: 4Fe-4S binding protein, partial [Saprospiraceae bacterium]|nr:4Fe-4S binding protein [Saprospiraceae bacterium]